jgi:hypothetical protein
MRSIVKSWPLRTAVPFFTISVILLWSLGPSAESGLPVGQFEPVLARFNSPGPPTYRAFRRLEAGLAGSTKHGWIEVWTEFNVANGFSYKVVREDGYEYVRNRVLRGVLKGEAELLENGKPLRAPLVPRNYRFEDGGITESGLARLLLHANRTSEGVVNGSALIAPDAGAVVRIEGRLVKSPSFWVRDVDVTWKFKRVGDTVVPTELSSSARVLLFGRSNFKMTYDYVQVDGQPVDGALKASLRDER